MLAGVLQETRGVLASTDRYFALPEESGMCYPMHVNGFNRGGGIFIVRSREWFLLHIRDLYGGDMQKQALINEMLAESYSKLGGG